MHRVLLSCLALVTSLSLVTATPAFADAKTDKRLEQSLRVFESFADLTEQSIPTWLLERAYGIVVVPGVVKVALTIGGRGGAGVMAVRQPDGSWSNPVFIRLAGANFGFQVGVQSTDVVLVLMSRESVEGIAGGKVTLGADASVAAGPLGRSAAATTDATLSAQILSYSRSSGVFAGVALDGTVISVDTGANETAYGISDVLASQILENKIASAPANAQAFKAALDRATTRTTAAPAAQPAAGGTPGAVTPSPAAGTAPLPPPSPAGEAQTYPMEDQNPGAPPPN
jgi:lipid-binding SYLF domain-containing protein